MRDLKKAANLTIDPWVFAKKRLTYHGNMLLTDTKTLQEWAGDGEGQIEFDFSGNLDEHGQPHFSGKLQVTLHIQCQRCLEMMDFPIQHIFDYVLIRNQDQENQILDGSESFICADDELNLAWFIEEEILLAMPMIAKHDNCNIPQIEDSEVIKFEEPRQNPFAQLKNLIEVQEKTHGSSTKS